MRWWLSVPGWTKLITRPILVNFSSGISPTESIQFVDELLTWLIAINQAQRFSLRVNPKWTNFSMSQYKLVVNKILQAWASCWAMADFNHFPLPIWPSCPNSVCLCLYQWFTVHIGNLIHHRLALARITWPLTSLQQSWRWSQQVCATTNKPFPLFPGARRLSPRCKVNLANMGLMYLNIAFDQVCLQFVAFIHPLTLD